MINRKVRGAGIVSGLVATVLCLVTGCDTPAQSTSTGAYLGGAVIEGNPNFYKTPKQARAAGALVGALRAIGDAQAGVAQGEASNPGPTTVIVGGQAQSTPQANSGNQNEEDYIQFHGDNGVDTWHFGRILKYAPEGIRILEFANNEIYTIPYSKIIKVVDK